jgi:hypothetical protein
MAAAFDLHSELLRLHEEGADVYVPGELPVESMRPADLRARLTGATPALFDMMRRRHR